MSVTPINQNEYEKHCRDKYPPFKLASMLMQYPEKFVELFGTALCGEFYPGGGPSLLPHINSEVEIWCTNAPKHDVSDIDWSEKENRNPVTGEIYEITEDGLPVISSMTPVNGQGKFWKYGWNRAADALGYTITEDENGLPVIKLLCVRVGGETAVPGGFIDKADSEEILQNFPHLEDFHFAAAREFCEECFKPETLENNPHIHRCVIESIARDGFVVGRNIPMTCDPRTTQNAGVCTSAVAFEIPKILIPYISTTGDGAETSATFWMDVVTPYMPGNLDTVVPMRANHNYLVAMLAAYLEPHLKLNFSREVWEHIRSLHKKIWEHTEKNCA